MRLRGGELLRRLALCVGIGGVLGVLLGLVSDVTVGFSVVTGSVLGALFFVVHGHKRYPFASRGDGTGDDGD